MVGTGRCQDGVLLKMNGSTGNQKVQTIVLIRQDFDEGKPVVTDIIGDEVEA